MLQAFRINSDTEVTKTRKLTNYKDDTHIDRPTRAQRCTLNNDRFIFKSRVTAVILLVALTPNLILHRWRR